MSTATDATRSNPHRRAALAASRADRPNPGRAAGPSQSRRQRPRRRGLGAGQIHPLAGQALRHSSASAKADSSCASATRNSSSNALPTEPLLQKWEQSLPARPGRRLPHRTASGFHRPAGPVGPEPCWRRPAACAFAKQPAGRIVFTRIAGVSCGILVLGEGADRFYRLWVDYTLAPYLWETLVEIVREM